ncbi:MAG: GTP-binding protein [Rectinemataceae bacterium]|jgi:Ni2+-binding GTPase involved in maturation of urease and hydrogenase
MYFVGGFLGSGKTTAIAGACSLLIAEGKRVGVVTNDQGKLQVDSLFMRSSGLPSVEVGGGCFCCRYDDFDARVSALIERELPDAVFAESVGSCADIVATVVKPFEAFRERYGAGSVFSVFADSRLLLARLSGRRLPFSEDVLYLFDRQLEEADILVLNKRDLLAEADRAKLSALAASARPDKELLEISGSTEEGARAWLAAMEAPVFRGERASLEIDYARYGAGERELAWLDERLVIEDRGGLSSDGGRCRRAVADFVLRFAEALSKASLSVGHLKLHVSAGSYEGKISLSSGDFLSGSEGVESLVAAQLPLFSTRRAVVAVNARVQAGPEELAALAGAAVESARRSAGIAIAEEDRSAFRPGIPEPTHRMA